MLNINLPLLHYLYAHIFKELYKNAIKKHIDIYIYPLIRLIKLKIIQDIVANP